MKDEFSDSASFRRSCLALDVAQSLLPQWEGAGIPEPYSLMPREIIAFVRGLLKEQIAPDVIRKEWERHCDYYEYINSALDWETFGDIVFLYNGCVFLLYRVLGEDDHLYEAHGLFADCYDDVPSERPTEYIMADPEFWDVHFVASIIAANGATWEEDRCDNEVRRAYWGDWLQNRLPRFLGSLEVAAGPLHSS